MLMMVAERLKSVSLLAFWALGLGALMGVANQHDLAVMLISIGGAWGTNISGEQPGRRPSKESVT